MTFDDILAQVQALLQREQRLSYHASRVWTGMKRRLEHLPGAELGYWDACLI